MSIKAIDPFAAEWFTLPGQEEETSPARFKIQGVDGAAQAEIADACQFDELGDIQLTSKAIGLLLDYGLTDWEGVTDGSGASIPFPSPQGNGAAQKLLPFAVQAVLARHLFRRSFLEIDEKKS